MLYVFMYVCMYACVCTRTYMSGLNTEANVDEHFLDATFINEDFDYDPFATQRFDLFHSCEAPVSLCDVCNVMYVCVSEQMCSRSCS